MESTPSYAVKPGLTMKQGLADLAFVLQCALHYADTDRCTIMLTPDEAKRYLWIATHLSRSERTGLPQNRRL